MPQINEIAHEQIVKIAVDQGTALVLEDEGSFAFYKDNRDTFHDKHFAEVLTEIDG